ncbi:MAG: extracellular solute-binding protein [Clostridiales bacterium]|nr:extracellular solute-binding protein [Clostridiales bacterium]
MKFFRKFFISAFCLCLAAPLAACNGGGLREKYAEQSLAALYDKFEGDLERGTPDRPITLHVLENDTAKSSGYLKVLLDGFNEKYKDYNIVAVDANQDQYSNLADDGPYGYGPDVLYQANDMLMKYCDGKHITPLPIEKLDAYNQLPELAKKTYTYNYKNAEYFMGVGVNMQAGMLYYRKDLLPADWETAWDDNKNGVPDMVEDMRKLYKWSKIRHDNNSAEYGFMQSFDDPYFSCGYLFSYGAYVFGSNNTNTKDIGFDNGNAKLGAGIILQLAAVMNSGCVDNSITVARESEFASGAYFAVPDTQDMYGTLSSELISVYRKQGMSSSEARAAAEKNIVAVPMPALPVSGDLTETDGDTIDAITMGGINGYAISSYTKYPKASLAFLNYATSYEMILKRNRYLGIAPARSDCNRDCTVQADVAHSLYSMVETDRISIMPSVYGVERIWTPLATAFTDIATDPYRTSGKKYTLGGGKCNYNALDKLLKSVNRNIYDSIYTINR